MQPVYIIGVTVVRGATMVIFILLLPLIAQFVSLMMERRRRL
jgi:hypothetical protein